MPLPQVPFPYFYPTTKLHQSIPSPVTHPTGSMVDQKHLSQSHQKLFTAGSSPPLNFSSKRDRFEENLTRSDRMKRDERLGSDSGPEEAMDQDEHVNVEID